MARCDQDTVALLKLTLTPGLGPIRIARLLEAFGSAGAIEGLSASRLASVKGIGAQTAEQIARGLSSAGALAEEELGRCEALGVRVVGKGSEGYPPLLGLLPDAPPVLYVKGAFEPAGGDRFPIAIVGSRRCSSYGIEQAERFAGIFATAGITTVSGGARGIDTAAHRGALRSQGRTCAVLGSGLGHLYPEENGELFARMLECGGSLISELPVGTPPSAENFPARNRIISGMSLGVVVIEAAEGSGALITAHAAVDDQGREVFALPGRVDSPTSRGSLELIKSGSAALVTDPGDVLRALEMQARHLLGGTFGDRYAPPPPPPAPTPAPAPAQPPAGGAGTAGGDGLFGGAAMERRKEEAVRSGADPLLEALDVPRTIDQLAAATRLPLHELRARLTVLELQRRVRRSGAKFERA
mgnify:CR=1 FL=1